MLISPDIIKLLCLMILSVASIVGEDVLCNANPYMQSWSIVSLQRLVHVLVSVEVLPQFGFPCFLEPAISLPYLSTHQHWPVLLWHWVGLK